MLDKYVLGERLPKLKLLRKELLIDELVSLEKECRLTRFGRAGFFLKALLARQMPRDRRLSRRRLQFDLQPQTGERGERSKKRGGRMGGSIAAVI